MELGFIVIIVVVIMVLAVIKAIGRKPHSEGDAYRIKKKFLTPAERSFYGVLCSAVANDYVVFVKVRVADVITPANSKDRSKWQVAFNRINAKHFDFVLCDPKTLSVEHVVDLNDRSHKNAKRKERDDLLRSACASAELAFSEIPARRSYSIDGVRNEIAQGRILIGSEERVEPHL